MFFDEGHHCGRPHFHVEYGEESASFGIARGERLGGVVPPRIERLVKAWARLHREELMANWERARLHQPLEQIEPLR